MLESRRKLDVTTPRPCMNPTCRGGVMHCHAECSVVPIAKYRDASFCMPVDDRKCTVHTQVPSEGMLARWPISGSITSFIVVPF